MSDEDKTLKEFDQDLTNIINDLNYFIKKEYDSTKRNFDIGDIAWALTTNNYIIPCKIIEIDSKIIENNKIFIYKIKPHGYKLNFLDFLKYNILNILKINYQPPPPWRYVKNKVIAGIDLFKTLQEASFLLNTFYLKESFSIIIKNIEYILNCKEIKKEDEKNNL